MQLRLKSVCDVCLGAGLLGCSLAVGQATRGRQVQAYEQLLYLLALRLHARLGMQAYACRPFIVFLGLATSRVPPLRSLGCRIRTLWTVWRT